MPVRRHHRRVMDKFAAVTGRQYKPFQYVGDPNAERVVILMGSGCETADETVEYLNERGGKVGVLKVRLYRPFCVQRFIERYPQRESDRGAGPDQEAGALGEPLYLDVVNRLNESLASGSSKIKAMPKVVGAVRVVSRSRPRWSGRLRQPAMATPKNISPSASRMT